MPADIAGSRHVNEHLFIDPKHGNLPPTISVSVFRADRGNGGLLLANVLVIFYFVLVVPILWHLRPAKMTKMF